MVPPAVEMFCQSCRSRLLLQRILWLDKMLSRDIYLTTKVDSEKRFPAKILRVSCFILIPTGLIILVEKSRTNSFQGKLIDLQNYSDCSTLIAVSSAYDECRSRSAAVREAAEIERDSVYSLPIKIDRHNDCAAQSLLCVPNTQNFLPRPGTKLEVGIGLISWKSAFLL